MRKQKRSTGWKRPDNSDKRKRVNLKKRRAERRRVEFYTDAELDLWEVEHAYQNRR